MVPNRVLSQNGQSVRVRDIVAMTFVAVSCNTRSNLATNEWRSDRQGAFIGHVINWMALCR